MITLDIYLLEERATASPRDFKSTHHGDHDAPDLEAVKNIVLRQVTPMLGAVRAVDVFTHIRIILGNRLLAVGLVG